MQLEVLTLQVEAAKHDHWYLSYVAMDNSIKQAVMGVREMFARELQVQSAAAAESRQQQLLQQQLRGRQLANAVPNSRAMDALAGMARQRAGVPSPGPALQNSANALNPELMRMLAASGMKPESVALMNQQLVENNTTGLQPDDGPTPIVHVKLPGPGPSAVNPASILGGVPSPATGPNMLSPANINPELAAVENGTDAVPARGPTEYFRRYLGRHKIRPSGTDVVIPVHELFGTRSTDYDSWFPNLEEGGAAPVSLPSMDDVDALLLFVDLAPSDYEFAGFESEIRALAAKKKIAEPLDEAVVEPDLGHATVTDLPEMQLEDLLQQPNGWNTEDGQGSDGEMGLYDDNESFNLMDLIPEAADYVDDMDGFGVS